MYVYILNYDKNTNLKNPDYKAVYDWLEKHNGQMITESIYVFKSSKRSAEVTEEVSKLFYKSDSANILYLVEDNDDKKTCHQIQDTSAYFKKREIVGSKTR